MFGPSKEKTRTDAVEATAEDNSNPTTQLSNLPRATGTSNRHMPTVGRRSSAGSVDASSKRLVVGEGLSVSGEITSCDVLVVAGKVEAKVSEGKLLEINETGQFRGSVEIENADIAGRYDGQLVVHGRLTVRSTGRISGMVKYGELEISAGGQIIGELQVTGGGAQQTTGSGGFKSAAKFTSLIEEENEAEERKSA